VSPFAVQFSETISLGWVFTMVVALAAVAVYTFREKSSAIWKNNYEAERARCADLARTLDEERAKKHEAINEVAALRLTKDITPVLEGQNHLIERIVSMQEEGESRYDLALKGVRQMFADHEERAQERHEAQLQVSQEIATAIRNSQGGTP
jgi:hypothetical protein